MFERSVAREFNLYQDLIVKYSDWPTYSYGVQQIATLTGFSWRDVDPSGANSIAWYFEYPRAVGEERASWLQRILDYNKDDCKAMEHIVGWYEARAG